MYNIAVFDRNSEHLKQIENYISAFLFDECEFKVYRFTDEEKLLDFFEGSDVNLDVICLDAEKSTNTGFYAAEQIRKVDVKVNIIFITSDLNGLPLGYKFNAFDYLIKPVKLNEFRETINRLFYYKQNSNSFFYIKINGNIERYSEDTIVCFASTARKVTMYTTDDSVDFYAKLDEVMEQLDKANFLRIHQSYIVNRQYVVRIEKKQLLLDNEDLLPISKKYYDDLKKVFDN